MEDPSPTRIAARWLMAEQLAGLNGHTFYHGTFYKDALSIEREGFKLSKMRSRGAVMGAGVYIAGQKDMALGWAQNVQEDGHDAGLLHLRINPRKPLSAIPAEWPEDMREQFEAETGEDPLKAGVLRQHYADVGRIAKKLGYDAVVYKEGTTVVYDPGVIRVVELEKLPAW